MTVGLAYALGRQLHRRRALDPARYRGPSVVLLLAFALVLGIAATVPFSADAAALFEGTRQPSALGTAIIVMSTQLVLVAVSWVFVIRPRAVAFAQPLMGRVPWVALRVGLGWGVLAWFGATALTVASALALSALGLPPETQAAERVITAADPWIVAVGLVVVAPIGEELFFRGVVFNAWLRERGVRFAYIGSALLFSVIHLSVVTLLPIFALGLALAWVYRRTGNLLAPIAMHAMVNGISTALGLLVRFGAPA